MFLLCSTGMFVVLSYLMLWSGCLTRSPFIMGDSDEGNENGVKWPYVMCLCPSSGSYPQNSLMAYIDTVLDINSIWYPDENAECWWWWLIEISDRQYTILCFLFLSQNVFLCIFIVNVFLPCIFFFLNVVCLFKFFFCPFMYNICYFLSVVVLLVFNPRIKMYCVVIS